MENNTHRNTAENTIRKNVPVQDEDVIDLLDLARVFWQKKLYLIIGLIAGAMLAFSYTSLFVKPQYESSSMIYIYSKTTSITSLTDLQIGSTLTVDFQIVAKTREVINSTIKELSLDTTYEDLVKKVTVTTPTNSRILKITVRDTDPQMAADISNSIANQLRFRIAEVMNTDEPSTVEKAVPAKIRVSPSLKKNTMIGGLGVFVIVAAIITVIYLLDDTIKTEDDVEKYLHQNVLAVFPISSEMSRTKGGRISSHLHK